MPRPGYAAGPCLVKDTMQLLAFARNEFALGNAAILVNEGLPLHIIGDLRILGTPHACYKDADLKGKPVVDVWGLLDGDNVIR